LLAAALLAACGTTTSSTPGASAPHRVVQAAQIQRAAVAPAVYELAYSARQNAVFVASAGGFGENAPGSKLLRLHPTTLAVQAELALPLRGFGVALDDAANRLYIGNTTEGSITVVDTASNQVIKTIEMMNKVKGADGKEKYEHHFRELVIDSANHRVYAPGLSSDGSSLYVLDTRTLTREKVIPGFGQVATGIALDAANHRLFVSNLRGGLYEVDTRALTITKRHAVAADQLLNLAYDAQGQRLFATDQGLASINERRQKTEPNFKPTPGNRVVVFDPDTGRHGQLLPHPRLCPLRPQRIRAREPQRAPDGRHLQPGRQEVLELQQHAQPGARAGPGPSTVRAVERAWPHLRGQPQRGLLIHRDPLSFPPTRTSR